MIIILAIAILYSGTSEHQPSLGAGIFWPGWPFLEVCIGNYCSILSSLAVVESLAAFQGPCNTALCQMAMYLE